MFIIDRVIFGIPRDSMMIIWCNCLLFAKTNSSACVFMLLHPDFN
jgi:hypothetical protein